MDTDNLKTIGKEGDILIREISEQDVPKLAEYANNEKVSSNLRDGFPSPYSVKDAKNFIKLVNSQEPKTVFAIEYQGEYVGNIGLAPGSDVYRKSAEIGYFIGEPFWNKGITTRAVNIITKYGFEQLGFVRIYTGVFEYNKSSQRVLEKCGYVKEAVFKKAVYKNGSIYDEIRYAKIREDD